MEEKNEYSKIVVMNYDVYRPRRNFFNKVGKEFLFIFFSLNPNQIFFDAKKGFEGESKRLDSLLQPLKNNCKALFVTLEEIPEQCDQYGYDEAEVYLFGLPDPKTKELTEKILTKRSDLQLFNAKDNIRNFPAKATCFEPLTGGKLQKYNKRNSVTVGMMIPSDLEDEENAESEKEITSKKTDSSVQNDKTTVMHEHEQKDNTPFSKTEKKDEQTSQIPVVQKSVEPVKSVKTESSNRNDPDSKITPSESEYLISDNASIPVRENNPAEESKAMNPNSTNTSTDVSVKNVNLKNLIIETKYSTNNRNNSAQRSLQKRKEAQSKKLNVGEKKNISAEQHHIKVSAESIQASFEKILNNEGDDDLHLKGTQTAEGKLIAAASEKVWQKGEQKTAEIVVGYSDYHNAWARLIFDQEALLFEHVKLLLSNSENINIPKEYYPFLLNLIRIEKTASDFVENWNLNQLGENSTLQLRRGKGDMVEKTYRALQEEVTFYTYLIQMMEKGRHYEDIFAKLTANAP